MVVSRRSILGIGPFRSVAQVYDNGAQGKCPASLTHCFDVVEPDLECEYSFNEECDQGFCCTIDGSFGNGRKKGRIHNDHLSKRPATLPPSCCSGAMRKVVKYVKNISFECPSSPSPR
eukprot:scaffold2872_cov193-Amphora_coffeaeformis.AAC.4